MDKIVKCRCKCSIFISHKQIKRVFLTLFCDIFISRFSDYVYLCTHEQNKRRNKTPRRDDNKRCTKDGYLTREPITHDCKPIHTNTRETCKRPQCSDLAVLRYETRGNRGWCW